MEIQDLIKEKNKVANEIQAIINKFEYQARKNNINFDMDIRIDKTIFPTENEKISNFTVNIDITI